MTPTEVRLERLREQLREMTELLESIAVDRSVLDGMDEADRKRLLNAVARVNHPDRLARRMKASRERLKRTSKLEQDDAVLNETGIRSLRRRPVFTTPNVFAPEHFEPQDVHEGSPEGGRS